MDSACCSADDQNNKMKDGNSSLEVKKPLPFFEVHALSGDTWTFPFGSIAHIRAQIGCKLNTISLFITLTDESSTIISDEADGEDPKYSDSSLGKITLYWLMSAEESLDHFEEMIICSSIVAHMNIDDIRIMEWILDHIPHNTVIRIYHRLWFYAASNGSICTIDYLLNKINRRVDIHMKRPNGYTALMDAAERGHDDLVNFLLDAQASVNQTHNYGGTAIFRAAVNGHASTVDRLIRAQANVNQKNANNATPLIRTANFGHLAVVERLLDAQSDLAHKNSGGVSALMRAALGGHYTTVQFLIQRRAPLDFTKKTGESAVTMAANGGHSNVVTLLVESHADISNVPLHTIAASGHSDIVHFLQSHGANDNSGNAARQRKE